MRVIAGTARGLRLQVPPGSALRPTSDRVREALFSILGPELPGARFLDLFAGTGAVAIEALSRGCAAAVAVEQDASHAVVLRANLAACRVADRAEVLVAPAARALRQLDSQGRRFQLVFLDPPYAAAAERAQAMQLLAILPAVMAEALLVVEGPSRSTLPAVDGLALQREARYGDTLLGFYRRRQG